MIQRGGKGAKEVRRVGKQEGKKLERICYGRILGDYLFCKFFICMFVDFMNMRTGFGFVA